MINLSLFLLFAQFGVLCFGGGYMTIPLMYHEFVEVNPVFTLEAFGNLLSVSQMTPGAVSINSATYVGFIQNNVLGAVAATVGLVTPTFILAGIAIYGLKKWEQTNLIQGFLKGARLVALAMICYATCLFLGMSVFETPFGYRQLFDFITGNGLDARLNPVAVLICGISIFCLYRNKLSITKMLFVAGLLGVVCHLAMKPFERFDFPTTDETPFECDDCVNGECGAWTNGCVCYRDQLNWSGKNCDEPPIAACTDNAQCPADTYCNIDKNGRPCAPDVTQGSCFARAHYAPFQTRGKHFVISRPITSHFSVSNFCASLGAGWRAASRRDLECDGLGIGCIHPDYIKSFQQKMGIRGFLWVQDTLPDCQAMYIDVNDGAVYNTRMNTVGTAQALCVYRPNSD